MATTTNNLSTLVAPPERVVPMRVIVCGVHRTGTFSTQQALRELGFHECYHMHTVFQNRDAHMPLWIRAFKAKYKGEGTFTKKDWDSLLGQSQACCDLPTAFFGAELAEMYPEAKVVILNRDPEKWYESVLETVYKAMQPPGLLTLPVMMYVAAFDPGAALSGTFFRAIGETLGYDHGREKDKALAWFRDQYQEFRDRIPAERRIEMTVKDGWKPLCEHLGVPVPTVVDEATGEVVEAPYPRVNDREAFVQNLTNIRANGMEAANRNFFALLGKVAVTAATGYAGYVLWKTRLGGRA